MKEGRKDREEVRNGTETLSGAHGRKHREQSCPGQLLTLFFVSSRGTVELKGQ